MESITSGTNFNKITSFSSIQTLSSVKITFSHIITIPRLAPDCEFKKDL